jgi:anaerobic magnesium-protoporphyrin IX monomethyl ester cyclase
MSMPDISPFYRPWKILSPSLGIASIAGNLDSRHHIGLADLVLKRKNLKNAVDEALKRIKPELVGLSALTFQYDSAVRVARYIKTVAPDTKIALGGYHATVMYQEISESSESDFFDFIFRRESENSFNDTVDALEKGSDMTSIPGLSFKENGHFIHNKKRELEDLDKIALPARRSRIWKGYHNFGLQFDTIESSRGCLMNCSFCSIRQMYGKSFRIHNISRVIEDIRIAKSLGTRALFFTDDNLTQDVEHFSQLLDQIIAYKHNDLTYSIEASSTGIVRSEKLVKKMAQAGFRFIFLGIENVSQKNLNSLKKGDILENSIQAIHMLKQHGLYVVALMILGNPDDDIGNIEENFKFASKMDVAMHDQILTPYLKTELRRELLAQDLIVNPYDYKLYNGHFANVKTKHLSAEELDRIKYQMVQRYSGSHFKISWEMRNQVPKEILYFGLKRIPLIAKDLVIHRFQQAFMNKEKRFRIDYQRCIEENHFNL